MTDTRMESDSFGPIAVPAQRLWGAQTQRSLIHFAISGEKQPRELLHALALVKRASAAVNHKLGLLDEKKTKAILAAADEVLEDKHPAEFPPTGLLLVPCPPAPHRQRPGWLWFFSRPAAPDSD